MINITKKIKITSSFLLMFFLSIIGKYTSLFLIAYLFALGHELFHIITAKFFKIKVKTITFMPFGLSVELDEALLKNPDFEIAIAAAGPLFNSVAFIAISHLQNLGIISKYNLYADYIKLINISMFFLNLLPALPLDGGRILRAILSKNCGILKSHNFAIKISIFINSFIIAISVILLLVNKFNFSLIIIGSFLISNLIKDQKFVNLAFAKEILNGNNKFKKNEVNNVKILAASCEFPAIKLLKYFNYNQFHVIYIIKDMKLIGKVNENEIMNSLITNGVRIRLADMLELKNCIV